MIWPTFWNMSTVSTIKTRGWVQKLALSSEPSNVIESNRALSSVGSLEAQRALVSCMAVVRSSSGACRRANDADTS